MPLLQALGHSKRITRKLAHAVELNIYNYPTDQGRFASRIADGFQADPLPNCLDPLRQTSPCRNTISHGLAAGRWTASATW